MGQAGNWLSESSFLIWSVFDLFPSLNRGPHLLTSRLLLHPWSFVRVWHLEDTHRHTHTKNDGEKVPFESTRSPYLTSGPHLPGQVRMAAPSHLQPLPSGQPLPRGPAACTPSPVVAVAIHRWVQRAGLHGIDAWSSRPSPVSVCLQVLVLRCSHQPVGGQRSLEQSTRGWVCLLGPSEALALETLYPGEEAVGGGSVVRWVLQGACWSRTTWVGSGLHPRHHQGLLRVG